VAEWPGFHPRQEDDISLYSHRPHPQRPTQLPKFYGTTTNSMGMKWPRREADQSPPSSVEVKKAGATPPLSHISLWRDA
jgi:hypothetical protein